MTALDAATVARAAPPGSMRQLAILFAPTDKRAVLEALHVLEHEVFESARNASHDVAHTRLQWWRAEIDRLANAVPQHPAARALLPLREVDGIDLAELHEMIVAADMDLARYTYESAAAVTAYARRAGGVIQALGARWIAAPDAPSPRALESAMSLGALVRESEAIRDLRQDVIDGRLYVSLDELERAGLEHEQLRGAESPAALRSLLQAWHERIARELSSATTGLNKAERQSLRHAIVLARLHERLLARLSRRGYDVASARVELGPLERVWVAWRAARSTV